MLAIQNTGQLGTRISIGSKSRRFPGVPASLEEAATNDEIDRTAAGETALDDDDDSSVLDSLPKDDECFDPTPGELANVEESDADDKAAHLYMSNELAIQLLLECQENDLVSALNVWYQKKGVTQSLKFCFAEIAHVMPIGSPYWRVDFSCPLTGSVYNSNLPSALLFSNTVDETLMELARKLFGDFAIVEDSRVVFPTKKAAKRSASLNALVGLGVIKLPDGNPSGEMLIPRQAFTRKRRRYPDWVEKLHASGIRASDLAVSYCEEFKGDTDWKIRPTLLSCNLQVKWPTTLNIMGDPQSSKRDAIDNAVDSLLESLAKGKASKNSRNNRNLDDSDEKRNLFLRDSNESKYVLPLPVCVNAPLPKSDVIDLVLYVYELEFEMESGGSFVFDKSGLDASVASPLGIAFTKKAQPSCHDGVYEARYFFVYHKDGGETERITARLLKRGEVKLDRYGGASAADRIHWMMTFNKTLYLWKSYGNQKGASKIAKTSVRIPKKVDIGNQNKTSPLDRTYLFVPLKANGGVDWALLQRVASFTCHPYMETYDSSWAVPYFGKVDVEAVSFTLFLVGLVLLAPGLYGSVRRHSAAFGANRYHDLNPGEAFAGVALLMVSLFTVLAVYWLPPRRILSPELLKNHFVVQAGTSDTIYVPCESLADNGVTLTGNSLFLTSKEKEELSPRKLERNMRMFELDLRSTSFAGYYEKRYGLVLRYPKEVLLECESVYDNDFGPSNFDFLAGQIQTHRRVYLAPELVCLLPMPRHFLYLAKHIKSFMPLFEREIQLAFASDVLLKGGRDDPKQEGSAKRSASLSALIKEATTISPEPSYQRLEFLGDAVLGLLVAMVIMARNSDLKLAYEELGSTFELPIKNHALYKASLRIGASRLLHTNQGKWRSAFSISCDQAQENEKVCYTNVTDKQLTDVVEALLGAAFLHDRQHGNKLDLAVFIFHEMQLPISNKALTRQNDDTVFDAIGPCLQDGYPFDHDPAWESQLAMLRDIVSFDKYALETNRKQLVHILLDGLAKADDCMARLESENCKTLLWCALFHDGGGPIVRDDKANEESEPMGEQQKEKLSRFRETLHLVGAYALQLCITRELFDRYANATEGNMHVMRACALSDDVVVYVMMKAGIDQTIHRLDPAMIRRLQLIMMVADSLGSALWKARGGWILTGGVNEYTRRCSTLGRSLTPQYVGLAGGRLYGQNAKLPVNDTEDLMFTAKAIIGALVLSIGIESMWQLYIGPLFEELLLLSPEELQQEYRDLSTIVQQSSNKRS